MSKFVCGITSSKCVMHWLTSTEAQTQYPKRETNPSAKMAILWETMISMKLSVVEIIRYSSTVGVMFKCFIIVHLSVLCLCKLD